jgi:hypothetical protein
MHHALQLFRTSFVFKENGYGYFFVVTFNFLKFTHILNSPFFLGTTTVDDNQMASSTCCINHVVNDLFMFCSTVVAWFGFILYFAWHVSAINVSNFI